MLEIASASEDGDIVGDEMAAVRSFMTAWSWSGGTSPHSSWKKEWATARREEKPSEVLVIRIK
jgi:hypothetical protein